MVLSLEIAAIASLLATALGTLIALALVRYRFRGRGATNLLIFLPMSTPEIVLGASLLTLFLSLSFTFGFWTAVQIATDAIDRLHTTAESHDRVIVVEVMGRHAGWIALHAGVAGGADVILIPEIPYDLDLIASRLREREAWGARFSIVVTGRQATPTGGGPQTPGEGAP